MAFLVVAALIFVIPRTRRARRGSMVWEADVRLLLFALGLSALFAELLRFASGRASSVERSVEELLFLEILFALLFLATAQLVALGKALRAMYRRRRGEWAFVTPLDYGVGEDWVERQAATSPYRDADIEYVVSRGSPSTAARAIFDDVVLMAIATSAVTVWCALLPSGHGSSMQTTKLALNQFRQSELTYRQVHPGGCLAPVDLRRRGEIDSTTYLDDAWGYPITISCAGDDEVSVSSAGPDGMMGTADDVTVPPRNDD